MGGVGVGDGVGGVGVGEGDGGGGGGEGEGEAPPCAQAARRVARIGSRERRIMEEETARETTADKLVV